MELPLSLWNLGHKTFVNKVNKGYPLNVDEVAGRALPYVFAVRVNIEHTGSVARRTLVAGLLDLDLLEGDELGVAGLGDDFASGK
jgi:hypothetical protein